MWVVFSRQTTNWEESMLPHPHKSRINFSFLPLSVPVHPRLFRGTRVKLQFGAIERERFRVRGAWRKRGTEREPGGGPSVQIAGSYRIPPPPLVRISKNAQARCTSEIAANGEADSRTMGVHPVSSYARELHGSEMMNAHRSLRLLPLRINIDVFP